ncbi:MAG TPA: hypothetical protein VFK04_14135 [Gemmatimonadaceae bacterium]|nr:hypothetical protein [Gemmatimonadaceae bacterium]
MLKWLVAAVAGVAIAVLLYGRRESGRGARSAVLIALRALAMTLLLALVLDAPSGPSRAPKPLVALDVSASWGRGGDSALWRRARERVARLAPDSLVLFGDSVRVARAPARPTDDASRARALVERSLASGRALVLVTDGELDDPASLEQLPSGSRVEVEQREPSLDLAVTALDAPRAVVSGDTVEVRATLRNGPLAVPGGTLSLMLGDSTVASAPIDSLAPSAERTQTVRVSFGGPARADVLTVVASITGDVESRNDTVAVPVDISRAAGAVLASTSPDFDSRFVLPVLRGAVALPTRAYFRVANGIWRQDGSLAPVSEAAVRAALREAPLAIIHGDTSYFGAPRRATTGSLALISVAPPTAADSIGEWYPVATPPSPLSAVLAGIVWDSLPPVAVTGTAPSGEWEGLVVARGRRFDRRPIVVGSSVGGRRVVVTGASGLWRWRFRGGASADAYAALWGGIFDWLTAERPDSRAALPAEGVVRAGETIRWRRGRGDSVVKVILVRRGTTERDSLTLTFGSGTTIAESRPLPAGTYDVRAPGGDAVLVVNESRELLPRQPTVRAGATGRAAALAEHHRLRDRGWAYMLLIALLCAEWLGRRRWGLR